MDKADRAKRVRIYIGEADKCDGRPMHIAILETLRRQGYAGATVLRGISGFGHQSRIHTASILRLSEDLPLIVEIVDTAIRIDALLPQLDQMGLRGLVTVEDVEVYHYGPGGDRQFRMNARVQDLMTRDVIAVSPETSILDALHLMYGRLFRALPVVNDEHRVVGIVTSSDLLERAGLPTHLAVLERFGRAPGTLELNVGEQPVSQVMSSPAVTIRETATAVQAAEFMRRNGVKRLPVVDAGGRLVGIVSRLDLLAAVAYSRPAAPISGAASATGARKVDEIMVRDVPTVEPGTSIEAVVDSLVASPVHRVVVVGDDMQVVGIISAGDLLARVARRTRPALVRAIATHLPMSKVAADQLKQADAHTAGDVMNSNVIWVPSRSDVSEAAQLMLSSKRKLMPVVDERTRLLGLLSRDDVLRSLASQEHS